ncbi:MAG: endonuclease/exonuclease/phosphatase family protein, partial [Candidatus Thorarchaeota archaeon]
MPARWSNYFLSLSHELHIDPRLFDGLSPQGLAGAFRRIKPYGRKLLGLPVLRSLYPTAKRFSDVAEPPGRLTARHQPVTQRTQKCRGLNVMSANLWHDWPLHRKATQRLEEFARLVETHAVDIILMQEVARTPNLRVDEWLSE